MKVTAAIMAKDEAANIEACVRSVLFCDEVLVLDSGSRDGTPALARALGARVVETDWPGYVAQRRRTAEMASHDWILSVDADERVDPALRAVVERLRDGGDPPCAGYELARHTFCLGRWIDHGGWWPEWRMRLYDRRRSRVEGVDPHDRVVVDGAVGRLREGEIQHFTYPTLSEHLRQIDRFTTIAAEQKAERGERASLFALVLRPPARFLRMYVLRAGFLDGRAGFVLAALAAYYVFLKYAKLWERTDLARRGPRA